jgi:hypothetical protein
MNSQTVCCNNNLAEFFEAEAHARGEHPTRVTALDNQRDAITVGDPVHPGPQHFDDRSRLNSLCAPPAHSD